METIEPTEAVEMYLADKQPELSQATIYSHSSRLSHFTRWCGQENIDDMSTLTGLKLHQYRLWRREDGDINAVTEKTQMDTLRVFIRWCESVDAVTQDLSEKVLSPSLSSGENERDEMLDSEVAEAILDYLSTFEYASTDHVTFLLAWRCLMRRGALRAIDLDGTHTGSDPYIEVEHRPETGTPLKKKEDGERHIALRAGTATVVQDYIDTHRHDVTDKHGREPLLTTAQGRPHVQTVQATIYAVTRPCAVGVECPHGRDPEECDAARDRQRAYRSAQSASLR